MHEYIAHFSDLLGHAYNAKATDVGTNFLANQFIEGIDETTKYTKNKLREKSGKNLDDYFQEAMRLQHKQEIRRKPRLQVYTDLALEAILCKMNKKL